MVLARIQAQILINQFNNIDINQQFHMDDDPDLNYVVSPIEVKINIEDQQGVKLCLKAKK